MVLAPPEQHGRHLTGRPATSPVSMGEPSIESRSQPSFRLHLDVRFSSITHRGSYVILDRLRPQSRLHDKCHGRFSPMSSTYRARPLQLGHVCCIPGCASTSLTIGRNIHSTKEVRPNQNRSPFSWQPYSWAGPLGLFRPGPDPDISGGRRSGRTEMTTEQIVDQPSAESWSEWTAPTRDPGPRVRRPRGRSLWSLLHVVSV